jgi:hypothetical protein
MAIEMAEAEVPHAAAVVLWLCGVVVVIWRRLIR